MQTVTTHHRGFTVRQYGAAAVVLDDEGCRMHHSTVVPVRAAKAVAERAFTRELSTIISHIAALA